MRARGRREDSATRSERERRRHPRTNKGAASESGHPPDEMASFFGMGRAPHQLSLRVTYEGYAKNPEDPDAPIPREGTLAVDWEAAEETSAVLERIDAQMRTLPFNHKGQVVGIRVERIRVAERRIRG